FLNPAPSVGTVFPVVVDPYVGFGCRDTLYAVISVSPKPVSDAGPDQYICEGQQIQIGSAGLGPGHNYEWTPASEVSNAVIPNPVAWNYNNPPSVPAEYIVKTTDLLTGCFS